MSVSSFPARVTREALGPEFVNARPVKDPRRDLSADTFNTVCSTVAGLAATGFKAAVLFRGDASGAELLEHREAWDPDRVGDKGPSVTREGLGIYRIAFEATYPDQNGIKRSTALWGALPVPQAGPAVGASERIDSVTYRVHIFGLATGPSDHETLVFFY